MVNNDVKKYFDNLACKWDGYENKTDQMIINLLDLVDIKKGASILDVGCGTGRITNLLYQYSNNNVTAIDLSTNMINIAKEKYKDKKDINFICDDFVTHKFDKKFDYIIVYNAFPHFLNISDLNNAFINNLNENGKFAILHSLSRKELQSVHTNLHDNITRNLLSPTEEAKNFSKDFNILIAKEDSHSFVLIGQKK